MEIHCISSFAAHIARCMSYLPSHTLAVLIGLVFAVEEIVSILCYISPAAFLTSIEMCWCLCHFLQLLLAYLLLQ